MNNETLVVGPPGTGKTSFCIRQTNIAAKKYGPDKVMVCSLTKAAAHEASGRDSGLLPNMIGTLHSHCYHALGRPRLAESKEGILLWNEEHKRTPLRYANRTLESSDTEEYVGVGGKSRKFDNYLRLANLLRAKKAPKHYWSSLVSGFFKRWTAFKHEHNFLDFADLIDYAGQKLISAPGNPDVIFADEAQDLSCAEHELLMAWGKKAGKLVIIADRDQSLYYWRGSSETIADSSRFHPTQVRILTQSYRVPKLVHKKAVNLIEKHNNRVKIVYKPTDVEGLVRRSSATYKRPALLDKLVDRAILEDKKIMILASCSYMLEPMLKHFKDVGIPYGNAYSGRWSPLRRSASQIYDYLKPSREYNPDGPSFWTVKELQNVVHNIKKRQLFRIGHGEKISNLPENTTAEELAIVIRDVMLPDVLPKFMEFDPLEFSNLFRPGKKSAMQYAAKISKRFDRDHLVKQTPITVGTIHSVKGGEADIVVLFPDLSFQGYKQYKAKGFGGRDAIIRLFYVGMTRTRDELIICNPSGGLYAKEVLSA